MSRTATATIGWMLLGLASGCGPPCGQVCRKLLFDCELDTERLAFEACETSCKQQDATYHAWEDDELAAMFNDHLRCLSRSSCDEIAQGVCYDGYEALFVFDPDAVDATQP